MAPTRRPLDPDEAVLTPALVAAVKTRLEFSAGMMSLRRALLFDPDAGVTDADVARWLGRAEELRASGETPATSHDRLCMELLRLDSAKGGSALVRAGMAMRRILDSRDQRAFGAQARLIVHLQQTHGDRETQGDARAVGVGLAQEDMDALSAEELERAEALLAERTRITAELEELVSAARRRLADGDQLH